MDRPFLGAGPEDSCNGDRCGTPCRGWQWCELRRREWSGGTFGLRNQGFSLRGNGHRRRRHRRGFPGGFPDRFGPEIQQRCQQRVRSDCGLEQPTSLRQTHAPVKPERGDRQPRNGSATGQPIFHGGHRVLENQRRVGQRQFATVHFPAECFGARYGHEFGTQGLKTGFQGIKLFKCSQWMLKADYRRNEAGRDRPTFRPPKQKVAQLFWTWVAGEW